MSNDPQFQPLGWIFYDGDCSFCAEIVERWRPALSKRGFDFAKLQDDWVQKKLGLEPGRIPEEMKVLAADGRVRGGADAVLFLAAQIWWARPAVWLARLPGIFHLVDRRYRAIAANRRCRLGAPSADESFRQEMLGTSGCSAILGAAIASGMTAYSASKGQFSTLLFFLSLGPLVLVPLALRAWVLHRAVPGKSRLFRAAVILQPFAALGALGSLIYGPGPLAAALAVGWFFATAVLGFYGIARLLRGPIRSFADLAFVGASLVLPAGGMWLLFARLGANPFRIQEPIATLSAIHFHYIALAAPTLFGLYALQLQSRFRGGLLRGCLGAFFAGVVVIAAGTTAQSALVRLFGVLLLSAGLAPLGVLQLFGSPVLSSWRQLLLRFGGLCVLAGLALAILFAASEWASKSWIAVDQMAVYHGALNGIGFSLLGLLAWQGRAASP